MADDRSGHWWDDSLCAQIGGDLFFDSDEGESPSTVFLAKAICAECPVRQQCLEDALDTGLEIYGVRGGVSSREFSRMLTARRRERKEATPPAIEQAPPAA